MCLITCNDLSSDNGAAGEGWIGTKKSRRPLLGGVVGERNGLLQLILLRFKPLGFVFEPYKQR